MVGCTVTSNATIGELCRTFVEHGLPDQCVTDNATCFSSDSEECMTNNGIKHSVPYHPAMNGQAEQAVQFFQESLKKIKEGDIETPVFSGISRFVFANATPC